MSRETLPDEMLDDLIVRLTNDYETAPNMLDKKYGDAHLILSGLRELQDLRAKESE